MPVSDCMVEGPLKRLRTNGIHLPPFRTKWANRYFVLRSDGHNHYLDEFMNYRKDRLRKSIDLKNCRQVESNLTLSDSSCSIGIIPSGCLFSISIQRENCRNGINSLREIFLIANSEKDMNIWVTAICKACHFIRRSSDFPSPRVIEQISSSNQSSESLIERRLSDVRSDAVSSDAQLYRNDIPRRPKPFRPHFISKRINQREESHHNSTEYANGGSSCASISSSLSSSHGLADDDASSVHSSHSVSGIPTIPRRKGLSNQFSMGSSSQSSRSKTLEKDRRFPRLEENESSGETIKLSTSAAPPVDRSKKPPKLQISIDQNSITRSEHTPTSAKTPRTPYSMNRYRSDGPKSADPLLRPDLDYFEPSPCQRTYSDKSPGDCLEYILIDKEKTAAVRKAHQKKA